VDDTSSNQISVGEEYVTLKSLNGADYTTIDGSTLTDSAPEYGTVIDVSAANVTIDGLTIKNNKSGDHDQRGIYIRYGGFTIQNNKFIDVPSDNILLSAGAVTSGTITNNTITGIGRGHYFDRNGILLECSASCSGVKITNNTISGIGGSASSGIRVARLGGTVTEITVQGNTVSDSFCGISLYGTVTGMTGTKAIANNTITGCVWGVKTSGTADVAFDLVKNTITNSKLYGIYLYGTTLTSTLTFKYNDISGNGSWGIYNINTAGVDVVAKYNYWGDATGPGAGTGTYASTTARGSGDNVSCEVTFSPWLYKPLADVVADNASYQAVEMKLIAGWNTLSTPVQLIAAADTIDELIPSGMTIGYYYDATGWHQITTGYVLNPCDAVYVKMSAITYVLFKFDAGAWTMPSKALAAGWNLVSLASLNASMQADDAVASVYKTAANLPGYSQVISPSLNPGQTDIYGVSGAAWSISCAQHGADLSTELMRPGLGYWIYMQNAATLAGFEITPIAPAFGL